MPSVAIADPTTTRFHPKPAALAPREEAWIGIDDDTAARISFDPVEGGLRVVALLEQRSDFGAFAIQVSTVLAPGQSADIAVPHWTGGPLSTMRLLRVGDGLRIETRPNPER